jgi:DNA-binding beta-propeller fold protein YncE
MDSNHDVHTASNVVYVHSNNPTPGKNAVLGYTRDPNTGELTEMPGSPFLTGGTGYYNATDGLGPDDTDQEMVATPDHRFLYTVNQGSNTIAGFQIQANGSLQAVPGSPFPSGGVQPGSLGVDGAELFVANRGDQNPGGGGGTHAPNYTGFLILPNGSLIELPWTQLSMVAGSSPTQALIAPNGRFLFDAHFSEAPFNNSGFPPFIPPYSTVLHSYKVGFIGELIPAAQIAPPAPIPPFILGLQVHPTQKIVYAGLVVASALGTYTYDDNGNLTFVGATPGAVNGGLCWVAISPDAKNIYTSDAITDQIDVYSIAPDPLHPVLVQTANLNGPKGPANFDVTATFFNTTPFQLATSPDGKFLYVVNHEVADPAGNAAGNALHVLKIGAGGMLTEIPSSPMFYPLSEVTANTHPLGVVVF